MPKRKNSIMTKEESFEQIEQQCIEAKVEHYKNEAVLLYLAAIAGDASTINELFNQKGLIKDWLKIIVIASEYLIKKGHIEAASFLQDLSNNVLSNTISDSGYDRDLYDLINTYQKYQKRYQNNQSFDLILDRVNQIIGKLNLDKNSEYNQKLIIDSMDFFFLFADMKESALNLIQDYFSILSGTFNQLSINEIINNLENFNVPKLRQHLILNFYQYNSLPNKQKIARHFSLRYPLHHQKSQVLILYAAIKNNHWSILRFFFSAEYFLVIRCTLEEIYFFEDQNFRIYLLQNLDHFYRQQVISDAYEQLFLMNNGYQTASDLLNDYVDYYIHTQQHALEITLLNLVAFFGPRANEQASLMLSFGLKILNYKYSAHTQNLVFTAYQTLDNINPAQADHFISLYTGVLLSDANYSHESDMQALLLALEKQAQNILVSLLKDYWSDSTGDHHSTTSTLIDQMNSSESLTTVLPGCIASFPISFIGNL